MSSMSGAGRRRRFWLRRDGLRRDGLRRDGLRRDGLRRSGTTAALVATALLAAGCGGGSRPAGSGASPAQGTVQKLAAFATCMRGHGEPNFYYSNPGSPNPSGPAVAIMGHVVSGVNPQTARFSSAMKSCKHLLPHSAPPPVTQQQIDRLVKAAACMRAHGYPDYPDPDVQGGHLIENPLPSSINTASPQFQSALKACNASP